MVRKLWPLRREEKGESVDLSLNTPQGCGKEELARHFLQSAEPLEIAAGDRRAGFDLDADQMPGGIFEDDVNFQPSLRPKVKELWLRLSPGRLLAQFADDEVFKDTAQQGTVFGQPLFVRAELILTIRIGPL